MSGCVAVWLAAMAVLSAPTVLYVVALYLPAENSLGIGAVGVLALRRGVPFLLALINAVLLPALTRLLISRVLQRQPLPPSGAVRRGARSEGDLTLLLAWAGRSVQEVVQLCMKYSNNSIAESLVKNLGAWSGVSLEGSPARRGDWNGGIQALRGEVEKLGVDLSGARLIDGSGLSEQNRLSPRMLVRALLHGWALRGAAV